MHWTAWIVILTMMCVIVFMLFWLLELQRENSILRADIRLIQRKLGFYPPDDPT